MDSAVLLDLLGNENRRRILRLLATKPCYVTEISEYLDVSPKAVIDHLRKLEEAGMIESTTDDQRRKYFRISRSLRLEVSVSPYGFGAKSAYPAKNSLDMSGRCPHLTIEVPDGSGTSTDIADLAGEYARLQDLDRELSLAQRWVQGRVEDTLAKIDERLGTEADSRFYAAILAAVIETDGTPAAVADEVGARVETVSDALGRLSDVGVLVREARGGTGTGTGTATAGATTAADSNTDSTTDADSNVATDVDSDGDSTTAANTDAAADANTEADTNATADRYRIR